MSDDQFDAIATATEYELIVTALARGIARSRRVGALWNQPHLRQTLELEGERAYLSLLEAGYVVIPSPAD